MIYVSVDSIQVLLARMKGMAYQSYFSEVKISLEVSNGFTCAQSLIHFWYKNMFRQQNWEVQGILQVLNEWYFAQLSRCSVAH